MTSSLSDLRLALRGLRRSPLFAAVAILSLALGIGATTAIFTLIDQILLRQLPRTGSRSNREEAARKRLPDDGRRRVGGGVRGDRSRAVSADSRAGADEAGDGAELGLAAHGRPSRPMGAGVRPVEARVYG